MIAGKQKVYKIAGNLAVSVFSTEINPHFASLSTTKLSDISSAGKASTIPAGLRGIRELLFSKISICCDDRFSILYFILVNPCFK